jgi:hypothetical protein
MPATTPLQRVAPRLHAAQEQERRERRYWVESYSPFGYLTVANAPYIVERLKELLVGKTYTFVGVNENMDLLHPEVRTGERLKDGPGNWTDGARDGGIRLITERNNFWDTNDKPYAHIMASTTYGVLGMSTSLRDSRAAWEYKRNRNGAVGSHHMSDPELKGRDYDLVYIAFQGEKSVEIYQRTSAGGRITWTLAIENDYYEDTLLEAAHAALQDERVTDMLPVKHAVALGNAVDGVMWNRRGIDTGYWQRFKNEEPVA